MLKDWRIAWALSLATLSGGTCLLASVGASQVQTVQYTYEPGGRLGALCRDGSQSKATGRGACSWHGGVREWLFSESRTLQVRSTALAKLEPALRLATMGTLAAAGVILYLSFFLPVLRPRRD
jgi:hypothetical protein